MTERAYVTNAADPQQVKKAKRLATLERERERADLDAVCQLERGRRFIWRLLCRAGVFQVSFCAGEPDRSAFLEGRREFGLQLMAEMAALNPELYHRMAREAHYLEQSLQPEPTDAQTQAATAAETEEEP